MKGVGCRYCDKFRIGFIDALVLSMRLEITGYNVNEGNSQPVAGCVLKEVCESKSRFIKRQGWMGKQAFEAKGSEALEGRLGTPLLHLVFQKKGIEIANSSTPTLSPDYTM